MYEAILSYLAENKTWIFSGVGVFVLAGFIAFGRSLLGRWKPRFPGAKSVELSAVISSEPPPKPKVPKRDHLTATAVVETYAATPLLLQNEVLKQFVGLEVALTGVLVSAAKTPSGEIRVLVVERDRHQTAAVAFEVDPPAHPGLGLLKSGHEVHVRGTIASVSDMHIINLTNAELKFSLPPSGVR